MGNLLCIHVHAANIHDTKGGVYTFEKALYRYPTIQAGCADGGYRGTFRNTFDEFHSIRIDISMQIKEQKGFQVLRFCEKISVNSTTVIKNDIVGRLEKQPLNFFTVYNKYRNLSSFFNSQSAEMERSGMEAD